MAGPGERITAETPEVDRRGHEFRYRLAAGFCESGDTVLDAACGVGYGAALLLAGREILYLGVDRDLDDLRAVHHQGGLLKPTAAKPGYFCERDLEIWDAEGCEHDVFVGFETIEHLDDCSAYIRAAKQARRWIILSCPVVPTVGINPFHRRDFEPGELPSLFVDDDWELFQAVAQPSELAEIYVLRRRGCA
jgi:SAM-dependent methyltransferase